MAAGDSVSESCFKCDGVIREESELVEGDKALLCEGLHKQWIHTSCAGVSDDLYSMLANSDLPWICPDCVKFSIQSLNEVKRLSGIVKELQNDIVDLKHQLANSHEAPSSDQTVSVGDPPTAVHVSSLANDPDPIPLNSEIHQQSYSNIVQGHGVLQVGRIQRSTTLCPPKPPSEALSVANVAAKSIGNKRERKFNIIIFGIDECQKGMPRSERLRMDEASIVHHIQKIVPSFNVLSIRDSFRLGKYCVSNDRPRPILATLARSSDVELILSKRSSLPLSGPIRIKPDLSPEERHSEKILLTERRVLLDSGLAERGSIRVRGSRIFIGERLHGRVIDGELHRSDSLGDHSPPLNALANAHRSPSPAADAMSVNDIDPHPHDDNLGAASSSQ